eukprot:1846585-Prymnesium_polylepis.2
MTPSYSRIASSTLLLANARMPSPTGDASAGVARASGTVASGASTSARRGSVVTPSRDAGRSAPVASSARCSTMFFGQRF